MYEVSKSGLPIMCCSPAIQVRVSMRVCVYVCVLGEKVIMETLPHDLRKLRRIIEAPGFTKVTNSPCI